jgi:hypothetical protein
MKKLSLLFAFISGIALSAIIGWKSNNNENATKHAIRYDASNPDSRPILSLRRVKLRPGVSVDAFEKFAVKVAEGEYGHLPGVKFFYGKGERGDEPNSYIFFMKFDSKNTRDFYAPVADDNTKTSTEVKKMIDTFFSKFSPEAEKLVEEIATGKKGYTDYIILE